MVWFYSKQVLDVSRTYLSQSHRLSGSASCSLGTLTSTPQRVPSFLRADGMYSPGRFSKQHCAAFGIQGSPPSPVIPWWWWIREAQPSGPMSHLPPLQPLLWHLTLTEWSSTSVYPCKGIILFQDSCLLIAVSLASLERNDKCYKQKINCGTSGLIMYPFQPTQSSSQATWEVLIPSLSEFTKIPVQRLSWVNESEQKWHVLVPRGNV